MGSNWLKVTSLALLALSVSVHAAPKKTTKPAGKKKPVALEIYQATEGESVAPSASTPVLMSAPPETKTSPKESVAAAGAPGQAAPAPLAKPQNVRAQTSRFDAVPDQHRESIVRRLKLVEQLVREHGRAYDYRTLTNQNLETILSQLDAEKQKTSPAPKAQETEDDEDENEDEEEET